MKIRPKRPDERSRSGHGIVTDLRGQDQAADRSRAQQVSTANEPLEPRRQRNPEFSTPPSRSKHPHSGDAATKHGPKAQRASCNTLGRVAADDLAHRRAITTTSARSP
jgi:hypothetical protein